MPRFKGSSERSAAVKVEPETVAFVRTVHAGSLLLLQSDGDRTQQESALMMIIEACNEELVRLGITDKSHHKLPAVSETAFNGENDDEPQSQG